jgi:hypothetical protein
MEKKMTTTLFEDFFNKITLKKEIIVEPRPISDKIKTTEFTEEMPMGAYLNVFDYQVEDAKVISEQMHIRNYRLVSNYPEVDDGINEIVNEAITSDTEDKIVRLELKGIDLEESIKKKIIDEFDAILDLLDFEKKAGDIFVSWYIDGRIYYEIVIDKEDQKKGILKLNRIDPLNIKKIWQRKEKKFVYEYENPLTKEKFPAVPLDLVAYAGSGYYDKMNNFEISYIHKALKSINNLRLIEDAIVIYRIIRAPEKRVFSIDTGNLPKTKAEEYIKELIQKFQNKITYDTNTGKITSQKNVMAMVEDFYLAKSASGQGSTITALQGGQNLGELDDLYYFILKVWKALRIPESRREAKERSMIEVGRSTTSIERDEVKFAKFIAKLRNQFSNLFTELLKRQLIWKNIVSEDKIDKIARKFRYIYTVDNYYAEIKETEMLKMRLELLSQVNEYVGRFFDEDFIALNILKMSEDEWAERKKKIGKMKAEKAKEAEKEAAAGGSSLENTTVQPGAPLPGKAPAAVEPVQPGEKSKE